MSVINLASDYITPENTVSNKTISSITKENHLVKAGERIAQREDQLGIPRGSLPLNQKTAILEAYRQLAGLPMRFSSVDQNGALVKELPIDVAFFMDVTSANRIEKTPEQLGQKKFDALDNINTSIYSVTGVTVNELAESAIDVLPSAGSVLTSINLVAIAGIGIAAFLLFGKLR